MAGIPSGPILELSLRLEIILRTSSLVKLVEFRFSEEFEFMLFVLREETLSGCCELE